MPQTITATYATAPRIRTVQTMTFSCRLVAIDTHRQYEVKDIPMHRLGDELRRLGFWDQQERSER